jgi:hypothetical protein
VNRVRADIPHTTCVLHGLRGFGARFGTMEFCAIELLFDGTKKVIAVSIAHAISLPLLVRIS